jgi:hypothetical protein
MTEYTDREAYEIGIFQKQYINWILLVYAIAFLIPYATWVAGIAAAYFVFKIAEAQKSPVAWLWALSQIIPFVGLVCLLILSQNATRILRGKGIKVGLLGAKSGELDKLVPPAVSPRSSTSPQKISYTVYGAHRDTGNDMNIKVQATGEQEAVNEANRCGILVSKVVAEAGTSSSRPQSRTWIKIAGGVAAVGLILVVLMALGSVIEQAVGPSTNTAASATKTCWRNCYQINLELYALGQEDPLEFWEQNYIRYGQLDLNNVDKDMNQFVKDWITFSIDYYSELKQIKTELQSIEAEGKSMVELGQSLGSTNRENPQGGAVAGGLMMGIFAEAYKEQQNQEILDKHKPAMDRLVQRGDELMKRSESLGQMFERRYGVEFD